MMFEYWLAFGLLVGIVMSIFDLPLRISRMLFLTVLGMGGAVVGGVFSYFLYGTRIEGVDVSLLIGALLTAIALLILREPIQRIIQTVKGGEQHAGWNI